MKQLLLAALLIIFLVPQTAEAKKKVCRMNVGTFNLRMDTPSDKENAWNHRKEFVKSLILFHDFDIFGTQEGFKHQLDDILETGAYSYVGAGRDDGQDQGEHSAIFYKKERFEVLQQGNFWFSETPEIPSYGWDAKIRRICSWAEFKDKISGKRFFFFNSHYDHIAPVARRESSLLLLKRIREIAGDATVFATGDFNASPKDEPIRILYESGLLKDSYLVSELPPYGPEGTFHGYKLGSNSKTRIDFIFVTSSVAVNKTGTLTDFKYQSLPSDHYPVIANVQF